MLQPMVSVVIATRNRANLLKRAVQSVLSQTLRDLEVIIIDDASTDETPDIIAAWQNQDRRIRVMSNPRNMGISRSLNRGFAVSRGRYIAIADDDDYWATPEKLARQVDFLEHRPEYVGVGGGMIVVDKEGRELFRYLKPETDEAIRKNMFFSNPMANTTTLFRRAAAEKVGFYDEKIVHAADRDFWMKMGKIGKLYNFAEYFTYYTVTGQNTLLQQLPAVFKITLSLLPRYKHDYPHYVPALLFNYGQYLYSFCPTWLRRFTNTPLLYIKRKVFDRVS